MASGRSCRLQQEIPPLNALAGNHEEEDGSDHQGNTSLPPNNHRCTIGVQQEGRVLELSIDQLCQHSGNVSPAVIWTFSFVLSRHHSAFPPLRLRPVLLSDW